MDGGIDFSVLRDDEILEIHLATLQVLARTGIYVELEEARETFDGGGAIVDNRTGIVKIPPHVVEAALDTAPPVFHMPGRIPEHDIVLEAGRVGFTNFGGSVRLISGALKLHPQE